jgi:predicted aldo/keto reductase-like oxidoreductase
LNLDKHKFNLDIEEIVLEKGLNYIEAVVYYCEANDIEVEVAAKMINRNTKEKLQANANTLNLLVDKTRSLPL